MKKGYSKCIVKVTRSVELRISNSFNRESDQFILFLDSYSCTLCFHFVMSYMKQNKKKNINS